MATELSKGKTMIVLAIMAACFAILFPKIFLPMFQQPPPVPQSDQQHIHPALRDRDTAGSVAANRIVKKSEGNLCCGVVFESDASSAAFLTELCNLVLLRHHDPHLTVELLHEGIHLHDAGSAGSSGGMAFQQCRLELLDKCGLDLDKDVIKSDVDGAVHRDQQKLKNHFGGKVRERNLTSCLQHHFDMDENLVRAKKSYHPPINVFYPRHMRPERPPHLMHPDAAMHPALREKGRVIPPPIRTIEKQAKPGPIPGMRPPMGGGAHLVSPPPGSGGMGILMPIYTVGIVCFFLYTIMKIAFKKPAEETNDGGMMMNEPRIKNFHMDPEHRKFLFAEEYCTGVSGVMPEMSVQDYATLMQQAAMLHQQQKQDEQIRRSRSQSPSQVFPNKIEELVEPVEEQVCTAKTAAPEVKAEAAPAEEAEEIVTQSEPMTEEEEVDLLRRRLEETERAMERICRQMGSVADRLSPTSVAAFISAKDEEESNVPAEEKPAEWDSVLAKVEESFRQSSASRNDDIQEEPVAPEPAVEESSYGPEEYESWMKEHPHKAAQLEETTTSVVEQTDAELEEELFPSTTANNEWDAEEEEIIRLCSRAAAEDEQLQLEESNVDDAAVLEEHDDTADRTEMDDQISSIQKDNDDPSEMAHDQLDSDGDAKQQEGGEPIPIEEISEEVVEIASSITQDSTADLEQDSRPPEEEIKTGEKVEEPVQETRPEEESTTKIDQEEVVDEQVAICKELRADCDQEKQPDEEQNQTETAESQPEEEIQSQVDDTSKTGTVGEESKDESKEEPDDVESYRSEEYQAWLKEQEKRAQIESEAKGDEQAARVAQEPLMVEAEASAVPESMAELSQDMDHQAALLERSHLPAEEVLTEDEESVVTCIEQERTSDWEDTILEEEEEETAEAEITERPPSEEHKMMVMGFDEAAAMEDYSPMPAELMPSLTSRTPPPPHRAELQLDPDHIPSVFLDTYIPPESHLVVSEAECSAEQLQLDPDDDEMELDEPSPVVLSGKMVLSVIGMEPQESQQSEPTPRVTFPPEPFDKKIFLIPTLEPEEEEEETVTTPITPSAEEDDVLDDSVVNYRPPTPPIRHSRDEPDATQADEFMTYDQLEEAGEIDRLGLLEDTVEEMVGSILKESIAGSVLLQKPSYQVLKTPSMDDEPDYERNREEEEMMVEEPTISDFTIREDFPEDEEESSVQPLSEEEIQRARTEIEEIKKLLAEVSNSRLHEDELLIQAGAESVINELANAMVDGVAAAAATTTTTSKGSSPDMEEYEVIPPEQTRSTSEQQE